MLQVLFNFVFFFVFLIYCTIFFSSVEFNQVQIINSEVSIMTTVTIILLLVQSSLGVAKIVL